MISTTPAVDLATFLLLGFYFIALIYVIFTGILYFHWMQYALDKRVRALSLTLYFVITLPLVGLMGIITLAS